MIGYEWITSIGIKEAKFEGVFDEQNHSIYNLSNNGKPSTEILENNTTGNSGTTFGLFGYVEGNTTIMNLNITVNAYNKESKGNGWGAVVACAKEVNSNLVLKNISVSGRIDGSDKAGGLVGDASAASIKDENGIRHYSSTLLLENCTNNAFVRGDRAAGLVCCSQNMKMATFKNCTNNGEIVSAKTQYCMAAGICVQVSRFKSRLIYDNCNNNGKLDGNIAYNLFTPIFIYKNTSNILTSTSDYFKLQHLNELHETCIGGAYSSSTEFDWKLLEEKSGCIGLFAGIEYDTGVEHLYKIERKIDNKTYTLSYKTFAELFDQVSSEDTIVLNADVDLDKNFVFGNYARNGATTKNVGDITFDLNGHVLTVHGKLFACNGGKITIKNGTIKFADDYTDESKEGLIHLYGCDTSKESTARAIFENINTENGEDKILVYAEGQNDTYVSTLEITNSQLTGKIIVGKGNMHITKDGVKLEDKTSLEFDIAKLA